MRVLAVSDRVNEFLYTSEVKKIAGDVDLIISCGDLPAYYLDFLVSSLGKPLFYICGNHDRYEEPKRMRDEWEEARHYAYTSFNLDRRKHFGGLDLDGYFVKKDTLSFFGLEGSYRYNRGQHQYTDFQMRMKIFKGTPRLFANRLVAGRFADVLVTHAPPFGIHDREDLPHRGFRSYLEFIDFFHPRYLLHGHTHIYDRSESRVDEYHGTKIINCYDYQILNLYSE